MAREEYTQAAFLDIEGAFNNDTTSSIENSLRHIHAPYFLVRFISHMLGNILIQSKLDGCSIVKRASRGTPQSGGGGAVHLFCGSWLLMLV